MLDIKHLPGATKDERVVTVLRRHWFVLIPLMLSFVVILLLPFLVYLGIQILKPEIFDDATLTTLIVMGGSIFFLFAWLFLYQSYIDFYLDTWIVSNLRILNIEQHGLFARTVSELRLHRVQDVTAEVHGFWRTMLDYGDVHIQTGGEKQHFEFEEIANPNAVAKMILDMSEQQRKLHLEEAVQEFGMPNSKV